MFLLPTEDRGRRGKGMSRMFRLQDRTALIPDVRNNTLTLIEREDDTRSWGNFLIYFSHMPCQPKGLELHIYS
jgi:hypothetical protein